MQAHCYFQRREDYEPKKTPEESPFRLFIARCLKCDCAQLKLAAGFDEESGETRLLVRCGKCGQTESVRIS